MGRKLSSKKLDRQSKKRLTKLVLSSAADNIKNDQNGDYLRGRIDGLNSAMEVIEAVEAEEDQPIFEIVETSPVTLNDVGGIKPIKNQLLKLKSDLSDMQHIKMLRGKPPKNRILLSGPPGSGKTLMARALAGETQIPMIMTHGSRFFETYYGKAREALEELFDTARDEIKEQRKTGNKNASFIVFIDEIECLVPNRSNQHEGSSDGERIGEMLVQMDGGKDDEGLIIMAATNYPEKIDPAILDRFHKQIHVPMPDVLGREEIFNIAARHSKLSMDIDLKEAAYKTFGFTGRNIEAVLDEASSIARQRGMKDGVRTRKILQEDFDAAINFKKLGLSFPKPILKGDKDRLAVHEAGHAVIGLLKEHETMQKLDMVTILPSDDALGFNLFDNDEQNVMNTYRTIRARIQVSLGGRAAEELVYGKEDVSTGASGDIEAVTSEAYYMLACGGYSDKIGLLNVNNLSQGSALAAMSSSRNRHDSRPAFQDNVGKGGSAAEAIVYEEARRIVEEEYKNALDILKNHGRALLDLSNILIGEETINRQRAIETTSITPVRPKRIHLNKLTPEMLGA